MKIIDREFFMQNTLDVAKNLLGKYIVRNNSEGIMVGRIVETEGYIGPFDKASHSYNNRRTDRNEVMYGPPGYAYVFAIYGMHYCMNVVTADINKPEAVLIRALEPVEGLDIMAKNRYGKGYDELTKKLIINLTNGPGKLCKAMDINKSQNGEDLLGEHLFITYGNEQHFIIESSPRVNIDYAEEARLYPWRYYIKDNPYVSRVKNITLK